MIFFSQRSNHDPIPSLITCSPRVTVLHEVPGRCRKPSHTASHSSALGRTLCDDHSRSTCRHSWDLLGKVVQLGVLEGSLYHKHEKMYHPVTACWLSMAGRGAGWLAEAHKGPKRPREAQRSGAWIEQACPALGWGLPTSRLTTREAPHKQIYDQGARTRTAQNSTEQ